jgi:hypothetical protein
MLARNYLLMTLIRVSVTRGVTPVFPPIPDLYASLTPAELAAFGIGPARAPDDDDEEEEATNNDEETGDND